MYLFTPHNMKYEEKQTLHTVEVMITYTLVIRVKMNLQRVKDSEEPSEDSCISVDS